MGTRARTLPQGWYPGSAEECKREIEDFLFGFKPPDGSWVGGVAPHAGWFFSGRAAAKVIRTLASSAKPDRVVVYGGHLGRGSKPIVYPDDAWDTPFGPLTLDADFARELAAEGIATPASRHFSDNTVEIQIPLIKHFFPDVPVIAVHSPASKEAIGLSHAVDRILINKALKAIYVGSADLTHYGPNYGWAPKGSGAAALRWVKEENDRSLIDKALTMDAEGVLEDAHSRQNTCSAGPIAAVMASAAGQGIKQGKLIEYYTSYDVMPGSSFVGYAAIVY